MNQSEFLKGGYEQKLFSNKRKNNIHVGLHISKGKSKSLYVALKTDITFYKINAAQIFVSNPRTAAPIQTSEENKKLIKNMIHKDNIDLFVHTAYITTMLWSGKPYGIKLLKDQMRLALEYGAKGVVLHLPKKSCTDVVKILQQYKDYINMIDIDLLLEPPAFKPDKNCSYEIPDNLNKLTSLITSIGLKHWGYTIDTAHLWSSISEKERKNGLTIETYNGADQWIKQLSEETKKRIKLIHLNGSHSNTGKDVHAIPVFGIKKNKDDNLNIPDYLWGKYKDNIYESSLYRFIQFARLYNIPMILEINVGTGKQIQDSLTLINKLLVTNV